MQKPDGQLVKQQYLEGAMLTAGEEDKEAATSSAATALAGLLVALPWGSRAWKSGLVTLQQGRQRLAVVLGRC